ncbi:MAG: hypothetical protein WD011_03545 [Nitriliruptoraceae bacterium]
MAAIGSLTVVGALGATTMALAHLDLGIAGFARLGPGRTILPAAVGFTLGALAYAAAAIAVFGRWRHAWLFATVVHAFALITSVSPVRNWVSVVAATVSGVTLVLLATPHARRTMRT